MKWISVAFVLTLIASGSAYGQRPAALAGVVVDETDAVLPRARVTVIDAVGRTIQTTLTDSDGKFEVDQATPGTYAVVVELPPFIAATGSAVVPESGPAPFLRTILRAGGFAEDVVVTGRRVETRIIETPQKVEIVDATDVVRTVAADLTDLLKKNSGVDVIQYAGVLSGIGIRGFRPQFSGINKRSLLLIDGRPSGVTNLGTLRLDGIDRIEVLKGAASSVYGSSAMGGVVNVITRQSRGKISGTARVGGGSYGTTEFRDVSGAALRHVSISTWAARCSISVTTIGWETASSARRPATRRTAARPESASTWEHGVSKPAARDIAAETS